MDYIRVIPRDFFNEAKLLKCMGQLALKILDCQLPDGMKIEIDETGEQFDIQQNIDGMLYINNYDVSINGVRVIIYTNYNDKASYPLVCLYDDEYYKIFDEAGNFTDEFAGIVI